MSYQRMSSPTAQKLVNPTEKGSARVGSELVVAPELARNPCEDYQRVHETPTIYHETKVVINGDKSRKEIKNANDDLFVDQEYNEKQAESEPIDGNDSHECNCFECQIRRNSDFSTEQLPLDIQMPLTLMSDSLMFCTIL